MHTSIVWLRPSHQAGVQPVLLRAKEDLLPVNGRHLHRITLPSQCLSTSRAPTDGMPLMEGMLVIRRVQGPKRGSHHIAAVSALGRVASKGLRTVSSGQCTCSMAAPQHVPLLLDLQGQLSLQPQSRSPFLCCSGHTSG